MSFYLSLFVFIAALVTGLAVMIGGKGMRREKFILLSLFHGIFVFGFIASLALKSNEDKGVPNYFFTAFVCSGIILSGLSWRSEAPKILRYYFSLFILTIPMFLFSPSMLLNFLTTMHYSSTTEPVIPITGKYFLERQSTSRSSDDVPHYKVILKKGMFHQTIQRDLSFGGVVDSIHLLNYENGRLMEIRGYTSKKTHVSADVDSIDVSVPLISNKPGSIEYHL